MYATVARTRRRLDGPESANSRGALYPEQPELQ